MKYNLILESWKQFLQEADMTSVAPTSTTQTTVQSTTETQDEYKIKGTTISTDCGMSCQ